MLTLPIAVPRPHTVEQDASAEIENVVVEPEILHMYTIVFTRFATVVMVPHVERVMVEVAVPINMAIGVPESAGAPVKMLGLARDAAVMDTEAPP